MPDRNSLQVERSPQASLVRPDADAALGAGLFVRGVCKRFHSAEVLRGVDLDVARGDVVALLGPNGAGKSTLLRIIAGSIVPDAGRIVIGGHDAHRDPIAARAAVSWVLGDEHGWYWRLSGAENLVFFGMMRGLGYRDARARAQTELEHQGLKEAADTRVGEYSTGMRARLALARASLVPTPALVLDEPGRGLDAPASERMIALLSSLSDTAVLLVSHDFEMVARVARRSILLVAGLVQEQIAGGAAPEELNAAMIRATSG